jgi:hypothetical protein
MLTVLENGNVQIRDIMQGKILCEMKVPETHEIMSPWDPVVAIGNKGQILYLRGIVLHYDLQFFIQDKASKMTVILLMMDQIIVYPCFNWYTRKQFDKLEKESIPCINTIVFVYR